jgi:hypothetical protein
LLVRDHGCATLLVTLRAAPSQNLLFALIFKHSGAWPQVTVTDRYWPLLLRFALIFKHSGAWPQEHGDTPLADSISNHFGAITQIFIGAMFGAAQVRMACSLRRPVHGTPPPGCGWR